MYADLVLTGAPVFTGTRRRQADTVAVRRGRILRVGTAPDVRPLIGPATDVLNTAGGLVIPGFQDAHVHPVAAGLQVMRCDLTHAPSAAASLAIVRAHAARHPGTPWIVGGGWAPVFFPGGRPHRRDLDRVVPDRPVYLLDADQHTAWVNSAALALAAVGKGTPDPPGGHIGRGPGGEPDGLLYERAGAVVGRLIPPPSEEELLDALRLGRDVLRSDGVTAWQDALIGPYLGIPDPFGAYLSAAGRGLIDWRVAGALWWDRGRGVQQIDELVERRDRARAAGFRASNVKIMQDGICETRTAALLEPYHGCPPGRGESCLPPDSLNEAVTELDRHGFHVHFHAVGDRAVRECLDAVAGARARNGPRRTRHQIAHLQVVHPDDLPRFRRLGVTATIQPLWAAAVPQMTELIMPALGPERSRRQYMFGALRRAGARLAAGSDWPVSSPNPLFGIYVAVTRKPAVGSAPWLLDDAAPFLPEEALPRSAALAAYTSGAAYVNGIDHLCGVLSAGRAADLVVLDRDILRSPPSEIARARVDLTMIGGAIVYAGQAAGRAGGSGLPAEAAGARAHMAPIAWR
jgi:predicted amidohydrolase YtcJ